MRTFNGTPASQELSLLEGNLPRIAASLSCAQVRLDKLTLPDGLFATNSAPLPEAALLVPLVVAEESGGHLILDGCKRYLAIRAHKRPACGCAVVSFPLSGTQGGLLRIMLNRGRTLDIGERVLFYKWLSAHGLAGRAGLLLGMQENEIHELCVVTACADDIVRAVCSGRVHAQNAADFGALSEQDRTAFLEFFDGVRLSLQTEREFLQWLPEIASFRGAAPRDILALPECAAAKNQGALNEPQKIERIRGFLHSLRYPQFDTALKGWTALARKTNPDPSCVQFIPDPFFEKDRLEVRVTVSKPDQAVKTFGNLREVSQEEWSELIRPPGTSGT